MRYTEDSLVQQTTAEYLEQALGWDSVYAFDRETFGEGSLLGRASDRDMVLVRDLEAALRLLNKDLPDEAYTEAVKRLSIYTESQTLLQTNRDLYDLMLDGVPVHYRAADGVLKSTRLKVIDFDEPGNNRFLCVRELWIRGHYHRRRADIIGFVNGLPLLFMELKNIHKDLRAAHDRNLKDYKDTVPHLFHHNAFIVLANGEKAKLGSLSSKYEHFHEWKRLHEEDAGVVDMETLLKGVCNKRDFLDLLENFILFDESSGKLAKIVARNHQFLGVNRAMDAVRERRERKGKLGTFWHTQGAGKSYSMVYFARKVRRKVSGGFTFIVLTDRDDLDKQIYDTFAGCGVVNNDRERCRAGSGNDLRAMLKEHKAYVFTLIQKFNKDVDPASPWTLRDDVIVMSDEAHRSQYGRLALNMRNALSKASFIGFTGTPLFKNDEITSQVFGDYISQYDFGRAVEDGATVPLYYDARGDKLGITTRELNEKIASKLEELEIEDVDTAAKLEQALRSEYHVYTASKRLDTIARDFVQHYSTAWQSGKAMLVCLDKLTCGRMYALIERYWAERIAELERSIAKLEDEQQVQLVQRQITWMRETRMAAIFSQEQNEVDKFRQWDLDVLPHRQLMNDGFETPDGRRIAVDDAFKKDEHPFRIAIVCAMWLTGFDVPSLSTLYLDKPLKAHTLMQAIARANRVYEGKVNGLIVDYNGITRNLREALATFAGKEGAQTGSGPGGGEEGGEGPIKPAEDFLIPQLVEAIEGVKQYVKELGQYLDAIGAAKGFHRIKAIADIKNAVNTNDETRKRFEVMAREVFKRFKACITFPEQVNPYRHDYDAINVVYKTLQDDRDATNIDAILKTLQGIVDEAIDIKPSMAAEPKPYDISKVDFERLRKEFEKSAHKQSAVQQLKDLIEKKLGRLIRTNPLRTDFQEHYQEIIDRYNREKDRLTIEQTFEELLKFTEALDEEQDRAIREGLDEESLALYDLLKKDGLTKQETERIKRVAADLLEKLKAEKLRVDQWKEKEATRDAVHMTIYDFLYDDSTGLPTGSYTEEEVKQKADRVFWHVMGQYGGGADAFA
ncbi:MAG: type I restriction endonuclease subunit R [Flavobacteriales bacterium]|nr:type I restriction endonuclease subunit R [Flavobacteriales bacterium]